MIENSNDNEIDLREFFSILWQSKKVIILITLLAAILSLGFALTQPNIYKATALLSPIDDEDEGGLNNLLGQFGGFANMAGISLPSSNNILNSELALEVIKSRAFIKEFIDKHEILPYLFAIDYWDIDSREIVLDKRVYNVNSKEWLRNVSPPKTKKPNSEEAYEEFIDIFELEKNISNGLVTISLKHQSPDMAKQWIDWIIEDINEVMRQKTINESQESIEYLKQQVSETNLINLDQVFFSLMQSEIQKSMLAETRKEYVLNTIDPAFAPELKTDPFYILIFLIGTLLGALIAVIFVLSRHYLTKIQE
tara:strand:- start:96 stop:1022 length:927 start_codon:yes stop_codon:yes gene_type:complete